MSKKVHCRSLSSIHILYNHDPVQALYSLPGRCTQFFMFNCTEERGSTCTDMSTEEYSQCRALRNRRIKKSSLAILRLGAKKRGLWRKNGLRNDKNGRICAKLNPIWVKNDRFGSTLCACLTHKERAQTLFASSPTINCC